MHKIIKVNQQSNVILCFHDDIIAVCLSRMSYLGTATLGYALSNQSSHHNQLSKIIYCDRTTLRHPQAHSTCNEEPQAHIAGDIHTAALIQLISPLPSLYG